MANIFKAIKFILKSLLTLAVTVVLGLGLWGSGWGSKPLEKRPLTLQNDRILIAHRGVSDQAPENTIAAAKRARDLGFVSMEIDLKESADQQFYLFHDRFGDRLFNRSDKIGPQTVSEIKKWPLYHLGKATEHRVPELGPFIDQFKNDFIFYFDIKRHGNDRLRYLSDKLFNFLKEQNLLDRSLVGGDFLFTAYLEKRYPQINTVFTGPGDGKIFVYHWIPKDFRPDYIISYAQEITSRHLDWLHKHQLMNRKMVYGVNGDNYQQVVDWGIPILVVDYHPIMDQQLHSQ